MKIQTSLRLFLTNDEPDVKEGDLLVYMGKAL